jgi:cytochrome c-type biogenesis protein CcmH/NrfG
VEGEAVLRDLVRQQPNNPEMHFYLGKALYEQKKPGEAVAALKEAIPASSPTTPSHTPTWASP